MKVSSKLFKNRDVIDINDFSKEEILFILEKSKEFDPDFLKRSKRSNYIIAQGEIAAHLFFEASTRTEQSFRAAAQKIGMGVIGFNDLNVTSMYKGESFKDTIRIMESYSNVLIIRHPEEGSAKLVADIASIPVINAGDGANQHPTQTLLDLYTIQKHTGSFDGLVIAFVGDLKYGRTVHALSIALSHFKVKQVFISHPNLKMPEEYLEILRKRGVKFKEHEKLLENLKGVDFLYHTRVQKERFSDLKEYEKIKNQYILNKSLIPFLDKGLHLMHPLPRINEIDPILDTHPNAIYFKQAKNGLYVREALLALVLGRI